MIEPHLHVYRWENPAFSKNLFVHDHWLLDTVGDRNIGGSALWQTILTVAPCKKELFMTRLLFCHNLASRQAGKHARQE